VFDRVEQLLAGADAAQSRLLHGDRVVLFLHLLATDMIGHAQRPHSPQYRASMRAVDAGVQRVVDAIQRCVTPT
jgi:predicted AlkP superfamily pyrophosphatase or phosphodiesterase